MGATLVGRKRVGLFLRMHLPAGVLFLVTLHGTDPYTQQSFLKMLPDVRITFMVHIKDYYHYLIYFYLG